MIFTIQKRQVLVAINYLLIVSSRFIIFYVFSFRFKMNKIPVNVYWKELPPEENQVKNILPQGVSNPPGIVLNSAQVQAYAKPWLVNAKQSSEEYKKLQIKKTADQPKLKKDVNVKKKSPNKDIYSKVNSDESWNALSKNSATLKDLCKEDRQKVASLIKELARFGEQKEEAMKQLQIVTADYEVKLDIIEQEKNDALLNQDILKEKLVECQVVIDNLKKQIEENHLEQNRVFYSLVGKTGSENEPAEKSVSDAYTDILMQQQKKFQSQQEALQVQINQLQEVQNSFKTSLKKLKKHKEKVEKMSTEKSLVASTSLNFENTKKLDNYLAKETNSTKSQIDDSILATDTIIETIERKNLSKQNNDSSPSNKKVDKSLQTDASVSFAGAGANDLEDYNPPVMQKVISFNQICSKPRRFYTKPCNKIDNSNKENLGQNSDYKRPKSSILKQQKNSVELFHSLIEDNTGSFSHHNKQRLGNSVYRDSSSVLKRRHFKPSSMLMVADGLRPPSTSTSIDQHSLKLKRTNISPVQYENHINVGKKKQAKMLNKTHFDKTYKTPLVSTRKYCKAIEIDEEEDEVLDDIFFLS